MKSRSARLVVALLGTALLVGSVLPATTLAATPAQEGEKTELELSKLRGEVGKQRTEAAAPASEKTGLEVHKLNGEIEKQKAEASKPVDEDAKIKAEVTKLKGENGALASIGRYVPAITALVAVLGIFLTLWKQINESAHQRSLDREQAQKDRTQRFDEQFNKMVEHLGSTNGLTRAAATAQIETFLRPDYSDSHAQVFTLLLATVRFPQKDVGDELLAQAFQRAAREQIPLLRAGEPGFHLDLSHCYIPRVDLSGLDLSNADLAFADLTRARFLKALMSRVRGREAKLDNAYLTEADLTEARLALATLRGAHLGKARLVSAQLRGVDATGASFQQASMQEVHLEQATLYGARFEQANLNNAYFAGAKLDSGAIDSIVQAENWEKAHFDANVEAELREAANRRKNRAPDPLADAGTP